MGAERRGWGRDGTLTENDSPTLLKENLEFVLGPLTRGDWITKKDARNGAQNAWRDAVTVGGGGGTVTEAWRRKRMTVVDIRHPRTQGSEG